MAIILEDNTDQIKEEILNFLKNSLKLNEQQIMFDNNLIKINLLK
jgi:xanthine dehydrogenase molybdopterin-binding subunit B